MKAMIRTWLATTSRKKILLLRHGQIQTDDGEKRFIGQIDLPLSEAGSDQARHWQSVLSGIPLGAIVASDLLRCLETARIIAGDDKKIETDAALREIRLGRWEGERVRDIKHRWPEAYRQRGLDMAGFRPPEGECFLDLQQRVVPVFEAAVDRVDNPVLIITHAGVIRMILCHVLGMPVENLFRLAIGYGAMTLIDRKTDGYCIQALNLLPDERSVTVHGLRFTDHRLPDQR